MKYIIIIGGALLILLILEIVRETHIFQVTRYGIETEKISEQSGVLRIAVLSDLHNCTYGKRNIRLLREIRRERPDLILVAGDMLVGKRDVSPEAALDFMQKVRRIAPVYYGNGNHEQRMKEEPGYYGDAYIRYKEALTEAGIVFLENASTHFFWKKEKIRITGLEIPASYYTKLSREQLRASKVRELVGEPDPVVFQILLAHNPTYGRTYARWGADLTVSGHLHGGIVRCPLLGGVITPQMRLFPKFYGGDYPIGGRHLVVSRGLGSHTLPIRLFNVPELVMLEIKGTK